MLEEEEPPQGLPVRDKELVLGCSGLLASGCSGLLTSGCAKAGIAAVFHGSARFNPPNISPTLETEGGYAVALFIPYNDGAGVVTATGGFDVAGSGTRTGSDAGAIVVDVDTGPVFGAGADATIGVDATERVSLLLIPKKSNFSPNKLLPLVFVATAAGLEGPPADRSKTDAVSHSFFIAGSTGADDVDAIAGIDAAGGETLAADGLEGALVACSKTDAVSHSFFIAGIVGARRTV